VAALIDEGIFDAVTRRLNDPRRRKQFGTDRRYLGSGLYLCGMCGAALDRAPLGVQRAVIGLLCTVRLLPAPRGRKGFDPETVKITWQAGHE